MEKSKAGTQLDGDTLYQRQVARRKTGEDVAGPTVVAFGLKSSQNVGAVLRLADAAGCTRVIFVHEGEYTPRKIRKTSRHAHAIVEWQECPPDAFPDLIPSLPPLVALELTTQSTSVFDTALRSPITLVVGSERNGIPETILAQCQQAVHIPMFGVNGSMNVTHALGIALFEWRRQQNA